MRPLNRSTIPLAIVLGPMADNGSLRGDFGGVRRCSIPSSAAERVEFVLAGCSAKSRLRNPEEDDQVMATK